MTENTEKIDCIKITYGKSGNTFYYHKPYYDTTWVRISKTVFDSYVEENIDISQHIEKKDDGEITFMKWQHESSKERRERLKNKPPQELKKRELSLLKKTFGKDGKYYYYESLSSVENTSEVYWYRIDQSYFDFLVDTNKKYASNTQYNEKGDVVYMEYNSSLKRTSEKKGCLGLLLIMLIAVAFFKFQF